MNTCPLPTATVWSWGRRTMRSPAGSRSLGGLARVSPDRSADVSVERPRSPDAQPAASAQPTTANAMDRQRTATDRGTEKHSGRRAPRGGGLYGKRVEPGKASFEPGEATHSGQAGAVPPAAGVV